MEKDRGSDGEDELGLNTCTLAPLVGEERPAGGDDDASGDSIASRLGDDADWSGCLPGLAWFEVPGRRDAAHAMDTHAREQGTRVGIVFVPLRLRRPSALGEDWLTGDADKSSMTPLPEGMTGSRCWPGRRRRLRWHPAATRSTVSLTESLSSNPLPDAASEVLAVKAIQDCDK
jgi:hypothetical protein